jgi:hypothetical protein
LTALALGTLFGFVRGLGVFPGARLTTTAKLADFHRRFDARAAWSRRLVIVTQLVVAVVAVGAVWGLVAGLLVAFALVLVFAVATRYGVEAGTEARELISS